MKGAEGNALCCALIKLHGVLQVEVSKLDVADMEEAKGVVALAEKQAPVGGIFHLAMILQDRWMANQVWPLAYCLYLLVETWIAPQ